MGANDPGTIWLAAASGMASTAAISSDWSSAWYGQLGAPLQYYQSASIQPITPPKPKGFVDDLRAEIAEWLKDALV